MEQPYILDMIYIINPYEFQETYVSFKLRLHDAIYQLRFYSNSLIHILSIQIRTIRSINTKESGR